jgi:DNA excision repair protein ERCC-4
MRLLVDHREPHVLRILQEMGPELLPLEVKQLPLGDFLLIHNRTGILIERKSVPDFLSSIRSNRLWDQLLRFMKAKNLLGYSLKRKLLPIHGTFDQYDTATLWPQVMGAYMEILFVYDIPIILAENDDALCHCMRILIQREKQGKNDLLPKSRWFRKHFSPDLPEMDIRRYVLASLPSVGDVLAGNLLDHFGSIAAIANATEKQLQRVEGIGKAKAEKIYQIFH